jgi:hypothetical protein
MRKTVLALASAAALMSLPALAQEGTATGAAAGAIVGGVVGGPVGAAIGAGVGAGVGTAGEAASRQQNTVVVEPGATGTVRERETTCVQGAGVTSCTETEMRR